MEIPICILYMCVCAYVHVRLCSYGNQYLSMRYHPTVFAQGEKLDETKERKEYKGKVHSRNGMKV